MLKLVTLSDLFGQFAYSSEGSATFFRVFNPRTSELHLMQTISARDAYHQLLLYGDKRTCARFVVEQSAV